MREKPLSEKISEYDGGDYWITAGIWRTRLDYDLHDTFEIGIRHKKRVYLRYYKEALIIKRSKR